jgi:hypothetical protein
VEGVRQGRLLASQLTDVAVRVKVVRPYAVKQMVRARPRHSKRGQRETERRTVKEGYIDAPTKELEMHTERERKTGPSLFPRLSVAGTHSSRVGVSAYACRGCACAYGWVRAWG